MASIYQMNALEVVAWHKHNKPHTLEAVRGSLEYQIEEKDTTLVGAVETGQVVILPPDRRHQFWAIEDDTIALTMIESVGSEVFGEPGGVLLAQADS